MKRKALGQRLETHKVHEALDLGSLWEHIERRYRLDSKLGC